MSFLPAIATAMGASASTAATLGTVGGVLGAVGTAVSVVGAIQGGKAEQSAADFNAASARQEAQARENAQRTAAQRQLGSIRAGVSKSGARMEGTPLAVLSESAANAEIDALNTRYSGQRESALYTARGQNARTAGYLRAGTSLLSGVGKYF
jgi:hypothetical protein